MTAVRPLSRFDELNIVGDAVSSFIEKPQTAEGWINGGFFVLSKKIFDDVSDAENITLEQGILERLTRKNRAIRRASCQTGHFSRCPLLV